MVLEIREGKQEQQKNESEAIPSAPSPSISEEQKFWTAVAEPPDIDLRHILTVDQDQIEKAVGPGNFGSDFTSRIMKYHVVDHDLEVGLLDKYLEWIEEKQKVASESGNQRSKQFWDPLAKFVEEDIIIVEEFEAAAKIFRERQDAQDDAEILAEYGPPIPVAIPYRGGVVLAKHSDAQIGEDTDEDNSASYASANDDSTCPSEKEV